GAHPSCPGLAWYFLRRNPGFFLLLISRVPIHQLVLWLFTSFLVTSNDFLTLLVFGDHRFLSQCLALLSNINVLAGYRIIFFHRNTIWVISAILTGDVSVASAGSRLHFDSGGQALFACHF